MEDWSIGVLGNQKPKFEESFPYISEAHYSIIPIFQRSRFFTLCATRSALCESFVVLASLDTNPADMLAEVESFGEDFQLLIATKVMKVLRTF